MIASATCVWALVLGGFATLAALSAVVVGQVARHRFNRARALYEQAGER